MGNLIPCSISSKSDCHRHSQEGAHDLISLETVGTGKFPGEKRLPETSEASGKWNCQTGQSFLLSLSIICFFLGGDACLYIYICVCVVFFFELCVLTCLAMVKHRMHLVHKDRGKSILVSQPTFWSVNQHICKHMVMNFHESVFAILT